MNRPSWMRHYIGKNDGNRRPQNYVFVDVETSHEEINLSTRYTKHTLKLGVACAVVWKKGREPAEKWFDFEHAIHFWEWLKQWQKKKSVLWVIAHNAQFDLSILGLWKHIEEGTYATQRAGKTYRDSRTGGTRISENWHGLLAIENSPFHVETEGPAGRVNFSDLFNYYPCSLAEIGRAVGITKGKWDDVRQSDNDLRFYCHNDVEITKRAYLGLVDRWEKEQNGNWQFSAAGLAYSHYRHKYMQDSVAIHAHPEASKLEWDALYGGEVRCWFRGGVSAPLAHYDVNSLYPSVMQDQVYPTALIDYILKPSRGMFRSLTDRYAAVADVDISTAVDNYPVRYKNKLVFPIGKFRTTLAGPELIDALDNGRITHCHSLAIYTYAPIFLKYTLEWWSRKKLAKQNGDEAGEKFAKLMLNSLPAKFAQRTPVWEDEPLVDVVRPWKTFPWKCPKTGTIYPARSVGWTGQVCRERRPTEHSFPLIYAYVTSYARMRMRELRKDVPPFGLYYQDTDSLIVNANLSYEWRQNDGVFGDELGQLKNVGEYNSAEFRGPKNYTVDNRHVIAGVKSRDNHLGNMRWSGERFERVNHLFMREPDSTIRTHIVDIDTPGSDSEGGARPDGFTRPIILPETLPPDVLSRIVSDANDRREST